MSLTTAPIFGTMPREDLAASDTSHTYMTKAVTTALTVGYRQFDLAEIYPTQAAVGQALATAFADSLVKREDLFLISKLDGLPGTNKSPHYDDGSSQDYISTKQRVQNMLNEVNVEYFDLLLIHYPLASGTGRDALTGDPSSISTPENWTLFVDSLAGAWEQMSRLRQDGLVKHIGLSNCYIQHLEVLSALLSTEEGADLAPIYAIRNFIDAAHHETELLDFCKVNHCRCLAYRPVVFIPVYGLLDGISDTLQSAATARGLNCPNDLVLYWLMSSSISPVVSSVTESHIESNYSVWRNFQQALGSNESQVDGDIRSNVDSVMRQVAGEREMVDMMGGADEYAMAFKAMAKKQVLSPSDN